MLTAAQREAQRALGNVGARNPKPERCEAGGCREWRALRFCLHCRRWYCWRHIEPAGRIEQTFTHACPTAGVQ